MSAAMLVLHAIWDTAAMHIWGEDPASGRSPGRSGRTSTRRKRPAPHPFAADHDALRQQVADLAPPAIAEATPPPTTEDAPAGTESRLVLSLPSSSRGPALSPQAALHDLETTAGAPTGLLLWTVPTLALDPGAALSLLASTAGSTVEGASFRFWGEAAKLCLEILAQQRFYPDVEQDDTGAMRAVWRPLLQDGDLPERLSTLARTMPPVCRALGSDGTVDARSREARPRALLESFLGAAVDEATRRLVARARGRRNGRTAKRRPAPADAWGAALASEDGRFELQRSEAESLVQAVREWVDRVHPVEATATFRTCFRLEPPEHAEHAGNGNGSESGPGEWTLGFHLQATDDRSLLVDAATVWRERSGTLTYLERRFENPQERLLADLGKASRLFPPLEQSLKTSRPTTCRLSTEQAYTFLRETAPLLEESGFGVLTPPWWTRATSRPGVRLKVKGAGDGQSDGRSVLGLNRLAEFDWEIALGDQTVDRTELERLASLKVPLVQVRGQWVEVRPEDIEAALKFFDRRSGDLTVAEIMRLGLAGEDAGAGVPVVGVEAEGWVAELLNGLPSGGRTEALPEPAGLHGSLRPYQSSGVSWMESLDRYGVGACLADDMGLGKTVQVIALLLHRCSETGRSGPTLLVVPTSVVSNWQRELRRFAPSLEAFAHHGPDRPRNGAFAEVAERYDVVITTYPLVHRDREVLAAVDWERIVLDEAQNIKNAAARQTQAVRSLNAPRRIALTGTPMENRLSELWSIMDFLNPGYLGSGKDFRSRFAIPIERYRDEDRSARLRNLVQPFILRRVKTDRSIIQDLPEKIETKAFCSLTREQASLYQAVVQDMLQQIEETEGIQRRGLVLSTLMKLKQVCNHPAQFLQDHSALDGRSGKLDRLVEMLEEVVSEGARALVFTQFAEMGEMLAGELRGRLGREVLFLHGGTSRKARDTMVQRFQSEEGAPPVFILSLKAGGTGLNLTAASYVFHFDRWWNPAVENQATDRAFRIGQQRNVQVYKFVCSGTVEERIDEMIEQKTGLAESIVGSGEDWVTEMDTERLRELFTLSRSAVEEE